MEQVGIVYPPGILCRQEIKLTFYPTFGGFLSSLELSKVSFELLKRQRVTRRTLP